MTAVEEGQIIALEDDITYEEIRTQGMELRRAGDTNAFSVGDLAVKAVDLTERATQRYAWARSQNDPPNPEDAALKEEGRNILKKLANDVGWTSDTLVTGARICRRFPATHRLRTRSPLSYHHARALVLLDNDADVERLIDLAITQRFSVSRLFEEVGRTKDTANVDAGVLRCFNCNERIPDADTMVKVQQHRDRKMFCGWTCTEAFVLSKTSDDDGDVTTLEALLGTDDEDARELAAVA